MQIRSKDVARCAVLQLQARLCCLRAPLRLRRARRLGSGSLYSIEGACGGRPGRWMPAGMGRDWWDGIDEGGVGRMREKGA